MQNKILFRPQLYIGDSIQSKDLEKLKRILRKKPLLSGIFLITLARNPNDQLDLFEAALLEQPYYKKAELSVVGIAGNREEAISMLTVITEDCLRDRNDCNIREYLSWQS